MECLNFKRTVSLDLKDSRVIEQYSRDVINENDGDKVKNHSEEKQEVLESESRIKSLEA